MSRAQQVRVPRAAEGDAGRRGGSRSSIRYCVTFYKTVSTSYGHDHEIVERVIEVAASDERVALEEAKAEFCRRKGLRHWTVHADRCGIERPDEASG